MLILILMLSGTLGFFARQYAYAAAYPVSPTRISGNYVFRGSVEDHRKQLVSLSGDLSLDWLGDISGEGSALRSHQVGAGPCHVLIDGSYTQTANPKVLNALIWITPGYGNCDTEFAKRSRWVVKIVSKAKRGQLDLIPRKHSRLLFEGVATRESGTFSQRT
jgi:hypothetical protein